jgi:hypothetical protein
LVNVNVVTVTPVVTGPIVVECSLTLSLGVNNNIYSDITTAQNLVNTAVNNYFEALEISDSMYQSRLSAAIQAVPGITYADFTVNTTTFVNSQAGRISVPLYADANVSNCTLKDALGNVLFTGNGTSYVSENVFVFTKVGLSDQQVTLTSIPNNQDIVLLNNQLIVLTGMTITSTPATK